MTIENLEQELKNGVLNNLYLFYGEEKFLLESCIKRIKKNFGELATGINYIQIYEENINTLIPELQTPAFGYPRKLIIVKDAKLFKKETKKKTNTDSELKEKLINYVKEQSSDNVLVIIEEEVEKNSLLEAIQNKKGIVCNFEFQKPMQIERRLKAICNGYKVNIDSRTLNHLIDVAGTDMQNLINEIRKLIEFAGENGTIKIEDIDAMTTKTVDSNIFDLTDNLGRKNITEAMKILDELIYMKEPIQKILITLYNHIKKLYVLKLSESQKRNVSVDLKLKPNQTFLINKYRTQSRYFEIDELKTILKHLIDLDYNYKIGEIDLNIGLESILCRYCS